MKASSNAGSGGSNSGLPRMDLRPMTAKTLRTVTPLRVAGVLLDLFSRVGQRSPPNQSKTEHIRFISIAVSNYNEKVRWGLDLLENHPKSPVYYTEDMHPPAFAAFHSVPASKDQSSQAPMVVLPLPKERAVWGSDTILREICSDPETVNLYPAAIKAKVQALEDELGTRLGATARCWGYSILFDKSKKHYATASKFLTLQCPRIEQLVFDRMMDRGLAKGMVRAMKVTEFADASEHEIRKVFDEMSQALEAAGGDYLMGSEYGFTAADLTLGALSYFIIRPPEMTPFLLPESETPPVMLRLGEELRETLAGKYVLKMYQQNRPIDSQTGVIDLKKVDQNRVPWKEAVGAVTILGSIVYGIILSATKA
ncbi:expressed unknown protein [Seminavis robusta]|uniref:Uncharacterized protein n=1 Tax=Seminavis robusta TaxID=568900 RepID=A0A9N8DWY3_9STRA|nr:expressed unknown protein [Seminavis robusta]|eukprot:Sro438_g143040.1 n/a (368) ;mRNA; f:33249-34352